MDINTLTLAVITFLKPIFPYRASKPSAVEADKADVKLIEELWFTLEKKFKSKPIAEEALNDLLKDPNDAVYQAVFRIQLKKILAEDKLFQAEIEKALAKPISNYVATLSGNGAIAQGNATIAVSKGDILISGNVSRTLPGDSTIDAPPPEEKRKKKRK